MTTNEFINNVDNPNVEQQDVIESCTVEAIQFHGHNFKYLPRTLVKEDDLFGEDILSAFNTAYEIEMLIDTVDGFEGDGDFLGKFGLEIRDTADFVVAKSRFEEIVTVGEGLSRPNEGDLIYFPLTGGIFEISFVEHENIFYQLGKNFTYKLTVQLFEYSQEDFNTGVVDIDKIETDLVNNDSVVNDPLADNNSLENEGDSLQDFSETNPFGSW